MLTVKVMSPGGGEEIIDCGMSGLTPAAEYRQIWYGTRILLKREEVAY